MNTSVQQRQNVSIQKVAIHVVALLATKEMVKSVEVRSARYKMSYLTIQDVFNLPEQAIKLKLLIFYDIYEYKLTKKTILVFLVILISAIANLSALKMLAVVSEIGAVVAGSYCFE